MVGNGTDRTDAIPPPPHRGPKRTLLKIFHCSAGVELKIPLSQSIILIVSNEFRSGAFAGPEDKGAKKELQAGRKESL